MCLLDCMVKTRPVCAQLSTTALWGTGNEDKVRSREVDWEGKRSHIGVSQVADLSPES